MSRTAPSLELLPFDLLRETLLLLPILDLVSVLMTCSSYHKMFSKDEQLWSRLAQTLKGAPQVPKPPEQSCKDHFQQTGKLRISYALFSPQTVWLAVYWERCLDVEGVTSVYNSSYYCHVTKFKINPTGFYLYIDEHGDNSAGTA